MGNLTETLTTLITNLYVSTGLLGIVLAMAIESCCIPLPSEVVMPLAGIMIASGKLLPGTNPVLAILFVAFAGSCGCLIGSIIAYGIGFKGGRPLMLKYGRYVLISQHDADLADKFFQRWGSATAFFSRLLPVVRTYISLPAGISKMPFVKFCIYTFLGSFPFCILLAYLGTILGNNLTKLSSVFHGLDIVIAIAVVILLVLYIWRHVRNDRKARAAHAVADASAQPMSAQNPAASLQQQQWGQQPGQPQPGWSQPAQQQQWGQQPPSQFQQQQQQWNQQPSQPSQFQQRGPQPQSPQQQQWGQQPQQSPQPAQQQQWGQQPSQPQQSQFHPQQGWGQQPQQSPQPPQQQQWGQQPPSQQQQWGQPWPPQSGDEPSFPHR